MVGEFIKNLPPIILPTRYVVMKPLAEVSDDEIDESSIVIFVVNADQLSALATLANFDRPTNDNVSTYLVLDVVVLLCKCSIRVGLKCQRP